MSEDWQRNKRRTYRTVHRLRQIQAVLTNSSIHPYPVFDRASWSIRGILRLWRVLWRRSWGGGGRETSRRKTVPEPCCDWTESSMSRYRMDRIWKGHWQGLNRMSFSCFITEVLQITEDLSIYVYRVQLKMTEVAHNEELRDAQSPNLTWQDTSDGIWRIEAETQRDRGKAALPLRAAPATADFRQRETLKEKDSCWARSWIGGLS